MTEVYFKARQVLQSITAFTQSAWSVANCDTCYKVRRNNTNLRKLKIVVSNEPNIIFYKNITIQKT